MSIGSSVFVELTGTGMSNAQTGTTERAAFVSIGRIHVMHAMQSTVLEVESHWLLFLIADLTSRSERDPKSSAHHFGQSCWPVMPGRVSRLSFC